MTQPEIDVLEDIYNKFRKKRNEYDQKCNEADRTLRPDDADRQKKILDNIYKNSPEYKNHNELKERAKDDSDFADIYGNICNEN